MEAMTDLLDDVREIRDTTEFSFTDESGEKAKLLAGRDADGDPAGVLFVGPDDAYPENYDYAFVIRSDEEGLYFDAVASLWKGSSTDLRYMRIADRGKVPSARVRDMVLSATA